MTAVHARRSKVMTVRVSPGERAVLRVVAEAGNTSVSDLVRSLVLPALRTRLTDQQPPEAA
jgi:hypothetical protein